LGIFLSYEGILLKALKIFFIAQIHIFIEQFVPTELMTGIYFRQSKEVIKYKAVLKVARYCLINIYRISKDIRAQNPIYKLHCISQTKQTLLLY